jgi:hypothetical protein
MDRCAEISEFAGENLELVRPSCGQYEVRAPIGEMAGDAGADATRGTGDDDDSALEIGEFGSVGHLKSVVSTSWWMTRNAQLALYGLTW